MRWIKRWSSAQRMPRPPATLDPLEVANVVVRQLERKGGACAVSELREAVAHRLPGGADPEQRASLKSDPSLRWSLVILAAAGEVTRAPARDGGEDVFRLTEPSSAQLALGESPAARRRAWWDHYLEEQRRHDGD